MTQTIQNYQETVNTLLFGKKAKNVKTTVNVNEICADSSSSAAHSAQLQKAQQVIADLEYKLKQYEG